MGIKLVHFSIGKPKQMQYGENKEMTTGICKELTEEAFLSKDGFLGDGVADLRFHGGPDRAVCVYPYEHYALWKQEFQTTLPPSAFGENITVTNMLEHDIFIGDTYQLGEAVIQITQGRIPCSTISKRVGIPGILPRIVETGYTGYLCRVLQEGVVRKDSQMKLLERHPNQVSILFSNEVYFHRRKDTEAMEKIIAVPELAEAWREQLVDRLAKLK
ncbi:MOSC domain-containing protein [Bacillus pseudomycoides]|uniref:MOSC domain-containing protein n=1 Tax=Bacillus pseudomycoides TaxID=64104 RepID=UPI000BEBD047|nr:MOSC domain-containing protein [Bacillus pseudomycoides]PEB40417.1 MOSC domain-containing protein [Bacillus pseudomycoides]PEI51432.1 MOSC domain-containing protein [Bacillus pseudomycoides]PEM37089.1 MOSC domain-containing protein [Bacillus pseudomycoides]PGA72937.1 MOSC domain-containing protein [Bacillus pseudomycoides]PGE02066.1 MOSC domain-containing protein [Bacillus pseudomycoides]